MGSVSLVLLLSLGFRFCISIATVDIQSGLD